MGCTMTFYNLFYYLEDHGMLQPDNDTHIQVLHMVYLPLIQSHLNRFKAALQRRPLRTENNRSPMQLWISGQSNSISDPETEVHVYL